MRHVSLLLLSMFIVSCNCNHGDTPPPVAHPEPVPIPPTPPTPPGPHRDVSPMTPETAHQLSIWLRQGRRAAHAHDYPTAMARFDSILQTTPNAPRVACEAGFVAHQAGQEPQAAHLLDLGVRLLGPDSRLGTAERQTMAMCLFNRGLVFHALGQDRKAIDSYRRSLALRPNPTVQTRLDALTAEPAAAPTVEDSETQVAGVTVVRNDDSLLMQTHETDALLRALYTWMTGNTEDGRLPRQQAELASGDPATRVLVWDFDDLAPPYSSESLLIGREVTDGFSILALAIGGTDCTDHGHDAGSHMKEGATSMRVEHGILRIDYTVSSSEVASDDYSWPGHSDLSCFEERNFGGMENDYTALCRLEEPVDCVSFEHGPRRTVVPGSVTIYCTNENDEDVEGPAATAPTDSEELSPGFSAIEALEGGRVRLVNAEGSRELDWDDALAEGEPFEVPEPGQGGQDG